MSIDVTHHLTVFKRGADELIIEAELAQKLAPGKPLRVVLKHAGGGQDELEVRHTLNAEQIGWFKAGSALNVLRR